MSLSGPAGPINAETADNFEEIEKQFAVKGATAPQSGIIVPTNVGSVVEHMSTYWSLLEAIPGSKLKLTKYDDEILAHFNKEFPDFDLKATIVEDDMKSKAGKEKWRNFISEYEHKIEDYNFGAMLRANPTWEYGEKETIFGEYMH